MPTVTTLVSIPAISYENSELMLVQNKKKHVFCNNIYLHRKLIQNSSQIEVDTLTRVQRYPDFQTNLQAPKTSLS